MTAPSAPVRLGCERLLLVITGSISAADTPFWGTWLRQTYPHLDIKVLLTPSATRFVTPAAIAARLGAEVSLDRWAEDESCATHVKLWDWADGAVVHPATFDYLSRLATGRGDSPSLLALQCMTGTPIVIAPALPPGGRQSVVYEQNRGQLQERPHVKVLDPQPGFSVTTGGQDAWAPELFSTAIMQLEALRRRLAARAEAA